MSASSPKPKVSESAPPLIVQPETGSGSDTVQAGANIREKLDPAELKLLLDFFLLLDAWDGPQNE